MPESESVEGSGTIKVGEFDAIDKCAGTKGRTECQRASRPGEGGQVRPVSRIPIEARNLKEGQSLVCERNRKPIGNSSSVKDHGSHIKWNKRCLLDRGGHRSAISALPTMDRDSESTENGSVEHRVLIVNGNQRSGDRHSIISKFLNT